MENLQKLFEIIKTMGHDALGNYVLPGLTSHLIGGQGSGIVRMFHAERETPEFITPHSHQYDFAALVLSGSVQQVTYTAASTGQGDSWWWSCLHCDEGKPGEYTHDREGGCQQPFTTWSQMFKPGEVYSMKHDEIHSIRFSKGAVVLMFEGPRHRGPTTILEPFVDGKTIPTFKVEPWMFQKEAIANP